MAIRYSGDVEVRLTWNGKFYVGSLRSPGYRGRGRLSAQAVGLSRKEDPRSSEAIDKAAYAFLKSAHKWARGVGKDIGLDVQGGKITVRRTFQSPCPMRT